MAIKVHAFNRGRKFWFENVARDIRYTGRRLRRDPAFVLLASLILALSVGANAAVFAVLETLLFQTVPVPHPEQLIRITLSLSGEDAPLSGPIFDALRQRGRAIAEIMAWAPYQTFLQDTDRSERVEGALASGNSFSVLHLRPQVGRLLKPTDDVLGGREGAFAAVVSDSFWKRRYGGSLTVLNRQVTINGIPVIIVGVMPPKFHGMLIGSSVDVVLPLEFEVAASGPLSQLHFAGSTWLMVFGRRNSGVSFATATLQLRVLSPAILREGLAGIPASTRNEFLPRLTLATYDGKTGGAGQAGSSGGDLREVYKNPLLAVQALSLFLLLLCMTNLLALQFSRSKAREHEFAIGESLGAPQSRIWSQLLIEGILVGIVGAVAALVVSYVLDFALGRLLADQMEEWLPTRLPNSIMIATTVGLAIGCMALCNVVIGLSLKRTNLAEVLSRSNFRRFTYTKSGLLNWQVLIPLQISVCMILLGAAGLFLGTLSQLLTSPMGFDPNGVVLLPFNTGDNRIPPAKQKGMEIRTLDHLRAVPGVSSAALLGIAPIGGGHASTTVKSTGQLSIVDPECPLNAIGPGYLEVMRTQLLQGREFQATDTAKSIPVCMLTRSAAKYFFPNLSALGRRLAMPPPRSPSVPSECQVVGVVQDSKYNNLRATPARLIYVDAAQSPFPVHYMAVRTSDIADTTNEFYKIIRQETQTTRLPSPTVLKNQINSTIGRERLASAMSGLFAALAVLVTALGIYGFINWSVSRRSAEIGVRMALGAQAQDVIWMMMRQILLLLSIGVAIGAIGSYVVAKLVSSMLYGMSSTSPVAFCGAVLILIGCGSLATWVPARRAVLVDPLLSLRSE